MFERNLHTYIIMLLVIFANIYLITTTHIDGNSTDIFVSYSGHSEVSSNIEPVKRTGIREDRDSIPQPSLPETTKSDNEADVIFVPNEKPAFKNEDYLENDEIKISDVVNERNLKIGDIIRDATTEPVNKDILFISGKNKENIKRIEKRPKHEDSETKTMGKGRTKPDCSNLECNKTVNTVCGAKINNKIWKYRLFTNECFFRKVNCAFKYPKNRYNIVERHKCSHIGTQAVGRSFQYPIASPATNTDETRRILSSRRSLNMDINGIVCSHSCPLSCTDKYEPQCAVTRNGQFKTFLNHCKLDYHSCVHKIEWHVRPLSECVGGKKADMQQNRGFIAWMQKVGIVDNRGRLVLS